MNPDRLAEKMADEEFKGFLESIEKYEEKKFHKRYKGYYAQAEKYVLDIAKNVIGSLEPNTRWVENILLNLQETLKFPVGKPAGDIRNFADWCAHSMALMFAVAEYWIANPKVIPDVTFEKKNEFVKIYSSIANFMRSRGMDTNPIKKELEIIEKTVKPKGVSNKMRKKLLSELANLF